MATLTVAAEPRAEDALEAYRRHHEAVRDELDAVQHQLELLADGPVGARHARMLAIVCRFNVRIRGHAECAERVLYPRVARELGDVDGLVAAFRHEHRLIGRRIDQLEAIARGPEHSLRVFLRHAEQLVGVVAAHLEGEEALLLSQLPAARRDPLPELPLG